ncbi:autotransporter domain-containing protein [Mesorhizobium sp. BAC0120]|uniref:autotransporter domain-containing protein n=1 Tax=Mesorhizobium sp. BAC0120 TaxID=3090670 RepID=UPI00298D2C1A|nr:autotransporter domain-containing protein [Mesorhizobium sp. BAC0120]MDW6025388.1 autotransporter domain-containing protein [Mesorhizobium sp. BAC0120]
MGYVAGASGIWHCRTSRIRRLLGTTSLLTFGLALSAASPGFATDWTGAQSSDWFTSGNWSNGMPSSSVDANIATNSTYAAVIDRAGASASNLNMGGYGTATLTIQNGGALSSSNGSIGLVPNSPASVTVDGGGSSWTNSGDLYVGFAGTGTVTIQNGGKVSNGAGAIGFIPFSTGIVTVDGTASSWTNTGDLTVGWGGTGTLIIQNGGAVNSANGYIGYAPDSTGAVTVDGTGSSWTNSGDLFVGSAGIGSTLTIQNGGNVSSAAGNIYRSTVTVDGAGSSWTNSRNLSVGYGTLTIKNGATISSADGIPYGGITSSGAIEHSTVLVDGTGSSWTNFGDFYVGISDAGALTIQNGGKVSSATGYIGFMPVSTGSTVTVDGPGSSWTNSGDLNVGYYGTGTLAIRNGGAVSAASTTIAASAGSTGTLNIGGGIGDPAVAPGTLNTPTVTFGAGTGQIIFNHTSTNYTFAPVISGPGSMTVAAGTTILTGANDYTGGTTVSGGVLSVSSDGNLGAAMSGVALSGGTLQTTGTFSTARAIIASSAASGIDVAGADNLTLTGTLTSTGAGTLTKSGTGTLTFGSALDLSGYSAGLTLAGGTLSLQKGLAAGFGTITTTGSVIDYANGIDNSAPINVNSEHTQLQVLAGSATQSGAISESNGPRPLEKIGAGVLNLTAVNSYTGGTTVSGGTLALSGAGSVEASSGVSLASGTTLDISQTSGATIQALNNNAAGQTAAVALGSQMLTVSNGGTFAGVIQDGGIGGGAGGGLTVSGGTLTLSGANTYTGPTTVNGGQLRINGSIASATTVDTSGTLSGSGSISGAVTVNAGGALSGAAGSTLTMSSLTLDVGSSTNVALGAPSTTGLFNVTGSMTLAGALNVSDAGGFGAGVYRLFDYGGTLTDNGLAIGSTPAGVAPSDLFVQTSVDNRINLISSTGATLSFWDGGNPARHDNGAVDGGSGVWRGDGRNWTQADGAVNGQYQPNPTFAVFQNVGGVVTVDASAGAIGVTGMQFAADGYGIEGDSIALQGAGGSTTIRVGDGTAAGASYTAGIASELTGSSRLVKSDLGTLILTGANSYSGGTTIAAGTLQIGNGGASGSITGDVLNDSVLAFDRSDNTTFSGTITGTGSVRLLSGDLTLTAANTYGGGTAISAGTLRGSATSFGSGAILDDAALVIDQPTNAVFANTIGGSGTFEKAGAGTLTLTGINSYGGGTTITAGTLVGNSASFGTGGIVNNAALVLNQGTAGTLSNALSGSGTFEKTGVGTLTLTGVNSYGGGTTITAGTLVGNSASFGTGGIVNNGALVLNQGTVGTLSNAISGSGTFEKAGADTLTLTGVNTYGGGTMISAGMLRGSAASFGGGAILDNAALVIDQPTHAVFANAINGSGSFTKTGAGALTLTGISALTGPTTIEAGLLAVNGSLANSTVTVANNAILGGTGTVGSVVAQSGSTIAPANGRIGTLNVQGNLSMATRSHLAAGIDGTSASDRIAVSGTANINGATLDVSAQGMKIGRYTLLTTGGGLTGTFGSVTGISPITAFLGVTDSYDAYNAYLDVMLVRDFADAGQTRNQKAAASGIQSVAGGNSFFSGNALYKAVLALPTDGAARAAFDQASGEVHASILTALIENNHFTSDAATNRIRAAFGSVGASQAPVMAYANPADDRSSAAYAAFASLEPRTTAAIAVAPTTDRFALWGQGFGGWGYTDSDGNAARLSQSAGGFLIGGDAPVFDTWRLGMMAGYGRTNFNVRDLASSGSSDNYHLGLYGGTQWGNLGFRTSAAYTWHDISTSRSVVFPGFVDSLKGDYRAGTAQVFGELGYGIRVGNFGFEPFANLAYVNLRTDGFTEKGGLAALRSADSNTGVTFTMLGLHASTDFALRDTAATVRGTLGWRHAFGDTTPLSTFALAGGSPFTVAGAPIAKDALVLDVGLDVAVARNTTLGISYGGQFGSNATDQGVKANFNVRF